VQLSFAGVRVDVVYSSASVVKIFQFFTCLTRAVLENKTRETHTDNTYEKKKKKIVECFFFSEGKPKGCLCFDVDVEGQKIRNNLMSTGATRWL